MILLLLLLLFNRFAIKTIFCSRDSELEMTLEEIRYLRMNRHPCVIDVNDAFITANPRYFTFYICLIH
jgi:hypothetical protein